MFTNERCISEVESASDWGTALNDTGKATEDPRGDCKIPRREVS